MLTYNLRVKRFSTLQIAEDLSELDRALVQLAGGHPAQQMHAIAR